MGKVITENDLRSHPLPEGVRRFEVDADTFVAESARAWLDKRGIELVVSPKAAAKGGMPRTAIAARGRNTYIDAATGRGLGEIKPEAMTHLRGNLLVPKTNPRITLRGKLDSMEAAVLEAQLLADNEGCTAVRDSLGDVLEHLRCVLAAEVREQPLAEKPLLGRSHDELRHASHDVRAEFGIDHPTPSWDMGVLALRLNSLRAQVREVELAAAAAFPAEGEGARPDIIEELNRMSSAIYIIFCGLLAGR